MRARKRENADAREIVGACAEGDVLVLPVPLDAAGCQGRLRGECDLARSKHLAAADQIECRFSDEINGTLPYDVEAAQYVYECISIRTSMYDAQNGREVGAFLVDNQLTVE
jgi:hypothetical protein